MNTTTDTDRIYREPCAYCDGTGRVFIPIGIEQRCTNCAGTGGIVTEREEA